MRLHLEQVIAVPPHTCRESMVGILRKGHSHSLDCRNFCAASRTCMHVQYVNIGCRHFCIFDEMHSGCKRGYSAANELCMGILWVATHIDII
jgi:hypothetical protein